MTSVQGHPEGTITGVRERHACLYVEGVVETERGWEKASFVVSKADIAQMDREQFETFARRTLPDMIEGKHWETPV